MMTYVADIISTNNCSAAETLAPDSPVPSHEKYSLQLPHTLIMGPFTMCNWVEFNSEFLGTT